MKQLLNELREFLQDAQFEYVICGGYAIDMYLGYESRTHADIDIGVFVEDRGKVISFIKSKNWIIYEAQGGGKVRELSDLANYDFSRRKNLFCVRRDSKRIHVCPIGDNEFTFDMDESEQIVLNYVEFLFNERRDNSFVYYWEPLINRELSKAIIKDDLLPYISPELALLYKSTNSDSEKNKFDFECVIVKLNYECKQWLFNALKIAYPKGHPWLNALENERSNFIEHNI